MAKYYSGTNYTIKTDWGGDETTDNLPLPGSAVQKIIKDTLNSKVGYIGSKGNKVYFSVDRESFDDEKYIGEVDSIQKYSMSIIEDSNNVHFFRPNDTNKEYVWYYKTEEIASKNVVEENISVEYEIVNNEYGVNKKITTTVRYNGDSNNNYYTKVTLLLDEYLTDGTTNITIHVKGLTTKQETVKNPSEFVILNLSVNDDTIFRQPVTGNVFTVKPNVKCTKGKTYFFEYKIDGSNFITDGEGRVGTGLVDTTYYNIDVSNYTNERQHVLEYRIGMNVGNTDSEVFYTKTQRIEFVKDEFTDTPNILFYSEYDVNESGVYEDGNIIFNGAYQYNTFNIKYAVQSKYYDNTLVFYTVKNGERINPTTFNASVNSTYNYAIHSMTSGLTQFVVEINVFNEETKQLVKVNERTFYVNFLQSPFSLKEFDNNLRIDFSSIGKDNNSDDKNIWVSNVKNVIYTAKTNDEFDFSQGWTSNGLVIGKNSKLTFNYAPFPLQKLENNDETEWVGGDKGYSFEIEFMTQNVTNENTILCDMTSDDSKNSCRLIITGSEFKFILPDGMSSVKTRFKPGEMNRMVIVINPIKNTKGQFKGLVELYVNGILSNIAKYSMTDRFEIITKDEYNNSISKNLEFVGSNGAELVIKYIRAYNAVMESDNVVNNYIIFRESTTDMLSLYNKNKIFDENESFTPKSAIALGNIPILIFVGRTEQIATLAGGDGNKDGYDGDISIYPDGYVPTDPSPNKVNWYGVLEETTDKGYSIDMDVIYYNPLDKTKNFKLVKACVRPQGTSSMYYPKKNYRFYTQKNDDTRMFLSNDDEVLEFDDMMKSNFGEDKDDRRFEKYRGVENKKQRLYSFKDNSQPVKCWCLKADFAETSSSHNTGIARLWGDALKNSTVTINKAEHFVFKTNAQVAIENKHKNPELGPAPDVRTTIDGFPILVFAKRSYEGREIDGKTENDPFVFLGKYNFNNDKSTESVFGFCDIDNEVNIPNKYYNYDTNESGETQNTIDAQLDKFMTCVETLDNGNALSNFYDVEKFYDKIINESGETIAISWEQAFEFRYPEIPEAPSVKDYKDGDDWKKGGEEAYEKDVYEYENETLPTWKNLHLKPLKQFSDWVYSTRWCDLNGQPLYDYLQTILDAGTEKDKNGQVITDIDKLIEYRKEKFATEKWDHLDIWKVAAYYVYLMRFGAVDQVVKNSMLTSEGPFAYDVNGNKYGYWDMTDITSENYGKYFKWYFINYDNDTIMGVKNDGSLAYGPDITRQSVEENENANPIYAGHKSTLWNNIEYDVEFQNIIERVDKGISKILTYDSAIRMFDVEQVGKWCERIYNKDAEYKYITPYTGGWTYSGTTSENFADKLFMLQGSRAAHRRWWLSKRFNLFDGKWLSGDFAKRYVEVKCDYGSIGDKFGAKAGSNAFFGYQINNRSWGDKEGGLNSMYNENEVINWELKKNIQIGDPIAIYGSPDILELNLQGLSKNLTSVAFYFGSNSDLGNKLTTLNISIPKDDLEKSLSYKTYGDDDFDDENIKDPKTGYEKLIKDYPEVKNVNFEELTYDSEIKTPTDDSPKFYRVPTYNDKNEIESYVYFAKVTSGVRNYSCNSFDFSQLNLLQYLYMAGYMKMPSLDLSNNDFITEVDISYSSIPSITFANGARISTLKVSNNFSTLSLTNCNSLKLENIKVDYIGLAKDGGENISEITIINSDGLNHSSEFKDFIIKWMQTGEVSSKRLNLDGIKWNNVSVEDIENIYTFVEGKKFEDDESVIGPKPTECSIKGVINMGDVKILDRDVKLFNTLTSKLKGLTINIPNSNIILNSIKSTIVAGDTAKYSFKLFPDKETIIDKGGKVTCNFVKKANITDFNIYDARTNTYYKDITNSDEVRHGISIEVDSAETNTISIKTVEEITNTNTEAILMVKLNVRGNTYFDISTLTIKDPTYATNALINGASNIDEKEKDYTYTVLLYDSNNIPPIGTVGVKWYINDVEIDSNNFEPESEYISLVNISDDGLSIKLTTSNVQPELIDSIDIKVKVENKNTSFKPSIIEITKRISVISDAVAVTKTSNEFVMDICHKAGWAASEDVMTKEEASKVTDIGTKFKNKYYDNGSWSFEEFKHFGVTEIKKEAFFNSNIKTIIIPSGVTSIGDYAFKDCGELENVYFGNQEEINTEIKKIPEGCFLNCYSLKNFVLPDSVGEIHSLSFGGTNIEKIIEKTDSISTTEKVIYLSKETGLYNIKNDAFETKTLWFPCNGESTNCLNEITLPNNITIDNGAYNFLLSSGLTKINIIEVDSDFSNILLENNILYNNDKTSIIRALCGDSEEYTILESNTVKEVYNFAFYNSNKVKELKLSNLTEYALGIGAFYNSGLEVINLEECKTLFRIKDYTFYNCKKLKTVTLPNDGNLWTLGYYVFNDSPELKTLVLPDTINYVKNDLEYTHTTHTYTINNCGITEFKVPEGLTVLPYYFLSNCKDLTKIKFANYSSLSSSDGGMYSTFSNLQSLKEVELPIYTMTIVDDLNYFITITKNGKTKVKYGPFSNLTIAKDELNKIKSNAEQCDDFSIYNIVSYQKDDIIIINNDLIRQEDYQTFEKITTIEKYILNEKDNHMLFDYDDSEEKTAILQISEVKNGALNKLEEKIIKRVSNTLLEYTIPDDVTKIGAGAFSNSLIKKINNFENITTIEDYAFVYNIGLEEFVLHSGITNISVGMFKNCENLKKLVVLGDIGVVGNRSLQNCISLTELYFMGNIGIIDKFAFGHDNNLSTIVMLSQTAPKLEHNDLKESIESVDGEKYYYYEYHPFGYSPSEWTGYNTRENNTLYLPYNYYGYDANDWVLPVFTENQCSFVISHYMLSGTCIVQIFENGQELKDGTVYLTSETGGFIFNENNGVMSAIYDSNNEGFMVDFYENKVCHNETIRIYKESDCTTLIGEFTARYGVDKYVVGANLGQKTRNIFSTTIFGIGNKTSTKTEDEYINIKKKDYETLLSRVNHLTERVNNLLKK